MHRKSSYLGNSCGHVSSQSIYTPRGRTTVGRDSITIADDDPLAAVLRLSGLERLVDTVQSSHLTLGETFALLGRGRPALLERLKAAGVTLIGDRQAVAKAIAAARRDPIEYRRANVTFIPAPPITTPARAGPSESRSQPGCFQDVRALQYFGYKTGGFYLEVGVADATYHNNTWLLDDVYGWQGVCVDPVVSNIQRRSCVWFGVALASTSGCAKFSMGGPWSGLTEFTTSPCHNAKWHSMAQQWQTQDKPTRTPLQVLEAVDAPHNIDYLSLDVEGAEMEVLRAFPWDRFTIGFATIETNDDMEKEQELRSFMRARGYTFLGHALHDDYFAWQPPSGPASLVFDPPLDYCDAEQTAGLAKRNC